MMPTLNLVVIRTPDLERAVRFYSTLGLDFIREKHGSGPTHYSCTLANNAVFEMYSSKKDIPQIAPARIGFCVPSLETTVAAASLAGGSLAEQPSASPWGRRAVLRDPDGNWVDLTEH